jgi:hypothetical protein
MASPLNLQPNHSSQIAHAPVEQPLLPDEILEDIFLLLDSGYDLARASTTCRAFHRVATGRSFLRRFLSLHPPPIVGFIGLAESRGFYLAELPHPSAPVARAVAQAGDFTFSFLPSASNPNSRWCTRDVRDGRFLLSPESTDASTFLELVVCDPLFRRYVQIPPIPRDLVLLRTGSSVKIKYEPFLAPAHQAESEEGSHFRVIYNWMSIYKVVSFVFSSFTGKWCCATSFTYLPDRLITVLKPKRLERYYARGCFYWLHPLHKYMLVLDPCEMNFSLVLHGKGHHRFAPVDAEKGRLGVLTFVRDTLELFTKTCQNNGVGAEEWQWQHDKFIPLPKLPGPEEPEYKHFIGASEGYLQLGGVHCVDGVGGPMRREIQCFTMNLQTSLVERLCVLNGGIDHALPYASFPPPFALPSL